MMQVNIQQRGSGLARWDERTERLRAAWAYEREPVEFPQVDRADLPEAAE